MERSYSEGGTRRPNRSRTLDRGDKNDPGFGLAPDHFLTAAAAEFVDAPKDDPVGSLSTLRYARIPTERADEWADRLVDLVNEFTEEPRGGDTTYGLLIAMYPTKRPHLPDAESQR